MINEKFNRTPDHHNSSLPTLSLEIDKDDFIEALNRLINKFGFQNFFYLTNTGKK